MKKLLIIGASGHGKVVADVAMKCGYQKIVFLDDKVSVKTCLGYPVLGTSDEADHYPEYEVFVAIGDAKIRETIQNELLSKKRKLALLVHPKTAIGMDVIIGKGTVVMAGTVINSGSRIGEGCIINTGSTVDHDNLLENYVHLSVGSHLAGNVTIGARTWIGIGATVSNNHTICSDCMIGAGAVVVKDIKEAGIYIGVPAKKKRCIY